MDELETTKRELEAATRELATMKREQELRRQQEENLRRLGLAGSLLCLIVSGAAVACLGFALGHWWGYLVAAATVLLVVLTAWLVFRWRVHHPTLSK